MCVGGGGGEVSGRRPNLTSFTEKFSAPKIITIAPPPPPPSHVHRFVCTATLTPQLFLLLFCGEEIGKAFSTYVSNINNLYK